MSFVTTRPELLLAATRTLQGIGAATNAAKTTAAS